MLHTLLPLQSRLEKLFLVSDFALSTQNSKIMIMVNIVGQWSVVYAIYITPTSTHIHRERERRG